MKVLFFVVIGLYFIITLIGTWHWDYLDVGTRDGFYADNRGLLILIALVTGTALFLWFKALFPKGWRKQKLMGKMLIPVMFTLLSFALNRQLVLAINNNTGRQEDTMIQGQLTKMYTEKMRRGYDYYVVVTDTVTFAQYKLRLSKEAYNALRYTNYFRKNFKTGSLGIIYRKEI